MKYYKTSSGHTLKMFVLKPALKISLSSQQFVLAGEELLWLTVHCGVTSTFVGPNLLNSFWNDRDRHPE